MIPNLALADHENSDMGCEYGNYNECKTKGESGDMYAQYFMGEMYYEGDTVNQDYKKAIYWYTKSAEQGDYESQAKLADIYFYGRGVKSDKVIAYMWLNIAFENGHTPAKLLIPAMEWIMTEKQIAKGYKLYKQNSPKYQKK